MLKNFASLLIGSLLLFSACSNQPNKEAPQPAVKNGITFDHKNWEELLHKNVNEYGYVDYNTMQQERGKLNSYLTSLGGAQPQTFSKDEQLAFWINAYNAFVIADVLDDVRGKFKSVHDIEAQFFKTKKHHIAGTDLTLDEIEKNGRDLKDARVHFALVCASISCPKLQQTAYTGEKLDYQLATAAREFLGDARRGTRYDQTKNVLYISPIFKWYAADFTNDNQMLARLKAEASGAALFDVIVNYVPNDVKTFLLEKKPSVDYFEYDWRLNEQMQNTKSNAEKTDKPIRQ